MTTKTAKSAKSAKTAKKVKVASHAKRGSKTAVPKKRETVWPQRRLFVSWIDEAMETLGSVNLAGLARHIKIKWQTLRNYRMVNRDVPPVALMKRLAGIIGRDHEALLGAKPTEPKEHFTKPKKPKTADKAQKPDTAANENKTTKSRPTRKPAVKPAGQWSRRLFVKWTDEARLKLSPEELAKQLGTTVMRLRNWRQGSNTRKPPTEVLEALGKLLGRDPAELTR